MERKKEIEIGTPLAIGKATLIPVVELSMNRWHGRGGVSAFGSKQPVAIVIVTNTEKHAFRPDGEEVPLDQFVREIPGLDQVLEDLKSS